MSRAERKLNRHCRIMREHHDQIVFNSLALVCAERVKTLAEIKRATRPGLLRRIWRWMFA